MTNGILVDKFYDLLQKAEAFDKETIRRIRLINKEVLVNSLRTKFIIEEDKFTGVMYVEEHGIYQNYGVKASRFNIGLTKWNEVTKEWAEIIFPAKTEQEIKTFQYFVWRKKKKEGLPAREWIKQGTEYIDQNIEKVLSFDQFLNELVESTVDLAFQQVA